MLSQIAVSIGQYSDKGRKEINQDFHGSMVPASPLLSSKGIAIALADGISSSQVSQIASAAAVRGFLEDYYCTSEAWSVKQSAHRVLMASNSWLYAQTLKSEYRYDKDRGYVCTFSALIFKSTTAHLFHIGDSRIYRVQGKSLEQLTQDHRVWLGQEKSYLSRALGVQQQLDLDYETLQLSCGDIFILATDGVYEFASASFITQAIQTYADDLDQAAKSIVAEAFAQGSGDNLTVQIIRIDSLPEQDTESIYQQLTTLPFPPALEARMDFDGYTIVRNLHVNSRSHVYLAIDQESGQQVVIKTPSIELRDDPAYLEQFLMEEWIARRINHANVLKPCQQTRAHNYLYVVMEYIDGQTLAQMLRDQPKQSLESMRGIVKQIASGLNAFHRQEMLHQDIRPDNIMIDSSGTVKIIDFGSTTVAGVLEIASPILRHPLQGTAQYAAPEYFIGENGTPRADLFSLGVIAYQMLSGKLPYGANVARCKTRSQQKKLRYDSLHDDDRSIPLWVDEAIKKAVETNPYQRYEAVSEFLFDLHHPNKAYLNKTRPPLLERNPTAFWQGVSLILALALIYLLLHR